MTPGTADLYAVLETDLRKRFERAVAQALPKLTHPNATIREVARQLLWLPLDILYRAFGRNYEWGYDYGDDVLGRLEFVRFFVGHELLDDGFPGVLWLTNKSATPCEPFTPDSHRSITPWRELASERGLTVTDLDASIVLDVLAEATRYEDARVAFLRHAHDLLNQPGEVPDWFYDDGTLALRNWLTAENLKPETCWP